MHTIKRLFGLLTPLLLLLLATVPAVAQDDSVCPSLVTQALSVVGESCGALGQNTACYGFTQVAATFRQEQVETFFAQPSDRAELVNFESLATSPLNLDLNQWGIAVLNVQANLPGTLPGQAVVFLLLGDVQIENQGGDPAAIIPPVPVTTLNNLNLRARPSQRANVLTSLPPGTSISADQRTEAGDWVRVAYNGQIGWVASQFVAANGDLSSLPTEGDAPAGPMQAFSLRTGLTGLSCTEAPPSLLVVQGPQQIAVNLTVNGIDVTLGSTVFFRTLENQQFQIGVIDGSATLGDGSVLPQGFNIIYPLDPTGQPITEPRPPVRQIDAETLEQLAGLEQFPPNLLHYPIDVPTSAQIAAQQNGGRQNQAPVATPAPGEPTLTPTPTTTGIIPLTVTTVCAQGYYSPRDFIVFNPNPVEIPISWSASTGESAFFFAPPNANRTITVNVPETRTKEPDPNVTFTIDWGTGTASATSPVCG